MQKAELALTTLIAAAVATLLFVSVSPAGSDFKTIDTIHLHSLVVDNAYSLESGQPARHVIVDARTKENYEESHIVSAVTIPETDFETSPALLPREKGELLVVYCSDAKAETSRKWAGRAAAAGYTNIAIYTDGFTVWKKNKMPTVPL